MGNYSKLCRKRYNNGVTVLIDLIVAGTLIEYLNRTTFFVTHIHKRECQSIFAHFEVS